MYKVVRRTEGLGRRRRERGGSVHAQSAPRHGAVGPASRRRCSQSSAWTRAPSHQAGCTKGRALCWPLASLLSLPFLAGRRPFTQMWSGRRAGPRGGARASPGSSPTSAPWDNPAKFSLRFCSSLQALLDVACCKRRVAPAELGFPLIDLSVQAGAGGCVHQLVLWQPL